MHNQQGEDGMDTKKLKQFAKQCGADLIGIAPMSRWEGAPFNRDPRYIFPEAKSCVVMAFRIPRGYLRGIEEGTCFAPYTALGYAGINEVFGPTVIRRVCCYLEDAGYEAVPQPNIYLKPNVNWTTSTHQSIPVAPDRPEPDVMIDMRVAAYIAGLGEFGYSKVFLTPEFGPLQRFVAILTDAELEYDPIFEGHICDRCKLCAKNCSGLAISATETETITIAGHRIEFAKINLGACGDAYRGGNDRYNPFLVNRRDPDKPLMEQTGMDLYMRHNCALEGARGCLRACYVHLEQTGRLKRKFYAPFRKRPQWEIHRDGDVKGTEKEKSSDKTLY